jgi:hypothetical protein
VEAAHDQEIFAAGSRSHRKHETRNFHLWVRLSAAIDTKGKLLVGKKRAAPSYPSTSLYPVGAASCRDKEWRKVAYMGKIQRLGKIHIAVTACTASDA